MFHFEYSINEQAYYKLGKSKKQWKCFNCSGTVVTRSNSQSSIDYTDTQEIKSLLNSINNRLDTFETLKIQFATVQDTLIGISKQYAELKENYKKNIKYTKQLEQNLTELEKQNSEKHFHSKQLKNRMAIIEQYSCNRNVKIHGLAETKDENCEALFLNLAEELNIPLDFTEVDVAHRIHSFRKDRPRPLLVQLSSGTKRNLFLSKRKLIITKPTLPDSNIGDKIYFNEQMSPFYKKLFYNVKLEARKNNFKYVWFKNGKLFAKISDHSRILLISGEDILSKISSQEIEEIGSSNKGPTLTLN